MRRVLPLCLWLAMTSLAQAQNWPSFRGPDASGLGQGSPPVKWNIASSTNIKWKTPIPGLGLSSPVVWGDRVLVTSAITSAPQTEFPAGLNIDLNSSSDKSPQTWHVYSVDRASGKIAWDTQVYAGPPRALRHKKNSFATPTIATDGKHIVAYFGSEGLYCLDMDGKILWKLDLGVLKAGFFLDPSLQWGIASSPILYENLVIVQADVDKDSFLAAYDVETGKTVWRVQRDDHPSWGSPTVYRGQPRDELVVLAPKYIRAYNPKTGQEYWHLGWEQHIIHSTPVPNPTRGLIYITSGKGDNQPILAIKPGGSGEIHMPTDEAPGPQVVWSHMRGGPITTTPLAYGDYLYSLIDQGVMQCFRADNGEPIYKERLSYSFMASPVAAGDKIYLPAESGEILVIKAGPKYELLAVNAMDEIILPTPAITGDMLIVRTQHYLYGIQEGAKPTPSAPSELHPSPTSH